MAKSDWKAPFLEFRDQIRPQFDAGITVYHAILMAPFHERQEIQEVIKHQAVADMETSLAMTVETPSEDCKYHAHFFYGDKSICHLLGQALSGIDEWILGVPKGLLPKFDIKCREQTCQRNLVTWASLVCHLAWEVDAPYFQMMTEYQLRLEEIATTEWSMTPWPIECDPRYALIHEKSPRGNFTKFLETFSDMETGQWCPDIIGAYVRGEPFCGDFIRASITAVDVLVFMLEQVQSLKSGMSDERPGSERKRKTNSKSVMREKELLRAYLIQRHVLNNDELEKHKPLTAVQIAEAMDWYNESGRPLQEKASRRMASIFGPNPMDKYCAQFAKGKVKPGFRTRLEDRTQSIDGIVEAEDSDDETDENDVG